jgi:hypothetical protein
MWDNGRIDSSRVSGPNGTTLPNEATFEAMLR